MIAVMTQIVAIDFAKGLAYRDDGVTMCVIQWFDGDNMPTEDWRDCVSFVAVGGDYSYLGRVADWRRSTIQ